MSPNYIRFVYLYNRVGGKFFFLNKLRPPFYVPSLAETVWYFVPLSCLVVRHSNPIQTLLDQMYHIGAFVNCSGLVSLPPPQYPSSMGTSAS